MVEGRMLGVTKIDINRVTKVHEVYTVSRTVRKKKTPRVQRLGGFSEDIW
jgi:hypothetical protein